MYTHKIAHKTNEISRRSDRKDGGKGRGYGKEGEKKITNVLPSYLRSNTRGERVIKTTARCIFFFVFKIGWVLGFANRSIRL